MSEEHGHLYLAHPAQKMLFEVTQNGSLVSTFDLASLQIDNPLAMFFAPSADATDDPATQDLFVLDGRQRAPKSARMAKSALQNSGSASGQIVELSFAIPAALPGGTTLLPSTLVNTIDASNAACSPSAPDTSGVDDWPQTGHLLIADSEVEEMPPYWMGKNIFESTLTGTLASTCTTFVSKPTPLADNNYSYEPTGIGIDPIHNRIYISDDSNEGLDLRSEFWRGRDVLHPG